MKDERVRAVLVVLIAFLGAMAAHADKTANDRLMRIIAAEQHHRLYGLASYYSTSLDGTLTANGEIYRNRRHTAAHLTLPLGTWVEVRSIATGKRLRLRINDRGPYVKKFILDLSRSAARYLGVDLTDDRTVSIRIIALPGEDPLPDNVLDGPIGGFDEERGW
ncbi:MAG TPA: septal ring lytic transglycosylase RlpA family protein [Thermoanaerobaculia bacterium]|jgi:rare lipoprotein A|nr:septal ring lytic transglycosylase RlpA family protein [Thermoanaerobaculia bacterium]